MKLTKIPETLIDEFVKSRDSHFFVIPAKAGIQFFQIVINPLDNGSCRRTGVTTFYETILIVQFS